MPMKCSRKNAKRVILSWRISPFNFLVTIVYNISRATYTLSIKIGF